MKGEVRGDILVRVGARGVCGEAKEMDFFGTGKKA